MTEPLIVWLRRDLRLGDNPALEAAAQTGRPVIPLLLWPAAGGGREPGAAQAPWLQGSALSLDRELRRLGSRLVIRHGPAEPALAQLAGETNAAAVHLNADYEPAVAAGDARLRGTLAGSGVDVEVHAGSLLLPPGAVLSKQGTPYKVFSAFHREFLRRYRHAPPLPAPSHLNAMAIWPDSISLDDLRETKGVAAVADGWEPGERAALARLETFAAEKLADYEQGRDLLACDGTSRLSPYLRTGALSVRQVWDQVQQSPPDGPADPAGAGAEAFLRQLVWREFCYHLLAAFPAMADEPLDQRFAALPWEEDLAPLAAWRQGQTGYPVVDAAMRQLSGSAWMHNRARMIVGSFLVKHLLAPWQAGENWFWQRLIDADPALNSFGWQWVAGSGADAAPFFRIFNPVLQGRKFDPDGDYVRRFVPELAAVPARHIHAPWEAPDGVLQGAGVQLGRTYPRPLVDHRAARRRALAAYELVKRGGSAAGPSD